MEQEKLGVSGSTPEGLEEILTVTRLGLPQEMRRPLGSTNNIQSMIGAVRQVGQSVKRWRDANMAPRWVSSGMFEAQEGFRCINPLLKRALARLGQVAG